jgi:murein DD-endopeptidase MepM/ murein hydrolase activator NlpD
MQKNIRNFLLAGSLLIWVAIIGLVLTNVSMDDLSLGAVQARLSGNVKDRPVNLSNQKIAPATASTKAPAAGETQAAALDQPAPTSTLPFVPVEITETIESTATEAGPQPTPTAPPLVIDFPTPQAAEIPQWRPALYDTPWAISPYDHFFFKRAIGVNTVNWPLANYRYGGIFPDSDPTTEFIHTGIDIDAPRGTPILAAADGKVLWAGFGVYSGKVDHTDPYGLAVTLEHDFGYQGKQLYTIYAHMDKTLVQPGQIVKAGDVLGLVGDTGLTTGPHLHFEVRWKGNYFISTMNPELWIAPPQGWGVLTGRVMNTNGSLLTAHDVTVFNKATRQTWIVRTYGPKYVNSDPYYRENTVLSDLPAGEYKITIEYFLERYTTDVTIKPGAVTYFSFVGFNGYNHAMPPDPDSSTDWSPVSPAIEPTPEIAATEEPVVAP